MEVSKQIKKYRSEKGLSQEDLAEKIYVSRQTISNWENNKSYPDIKSLLMLSNLFDVSVDILVKGDVEEMKKIIEVSDIKKFKHDSKIYAIFLACIMLLGGPLVYKLGVVGLVIYLVIAAIGIYYSVRVEKLKKEFDVHTYKEIIAFTEKRSLTDVEKHEERGKRPYQTAIIAILSAVISAGIATIVFKILY